MQPVQLNHVGFHPRVSDSRILAFLSDKLIRSKNDREIVDLSLSNAPMSERGSNHICSSHERQHCSLGNSLQRLILAARFELDRLFESKTRALRGFNSNGRRPRVPPNFDKHVYSLDQGLAMALKIEEARSRGRDGHMARVFKDVTKEVKYPTEENYANEMAIELYWVGPNDGSKGFWMQLKYRHLLQDDGTPSFKKLIDAVSVKFLDGVPLGLGIWDHTGCMILNDKGLEECIDDAARRGLRGPRWRARADGSNVSSSGCLCCVYTQGNYEYPPDSKDGDGEGSETISGREKEIKKKGIEIKEEDIRTKPDEWRAIPFWTPQNSKTGSGEEIVDIWKQRLQSEELLQMHGGEKVEEWLTRLPCTLSKDSQEEKWKLEAREQRGRKRINEEEKPREVESGSERLRKRRKMDGWGR